MFLIFGLIFLQKLTGEARFVKFISVGNTTYALCLQDVKYIDNVFATY